MEHMIRQKIKSRASDVFLDLVRAFPLKPIRSEADHDAANRTLQRLAGSKPEDRFTTGERDYLEALTILVRDYQQRRKSGEYSRLKPVEILRHLMEENRMTVTDLGHVIGSRTAASMILHEKRSPSKLHILRLADRFRVNPSLFFEE
jgi:HTH-type transcriptional regulator/antitoxin HigA